MTSSDTLPAADRQANVVPSANGIWRRYPYPSAETGTVMRRSTLERYASTAGFSAVSVLPIEHDFLRFYRLDP